MQKLFNNNTFFHKSAFLNFSKVSIAWEKSPTVINYFYETTSIEEIKDNILTISVIGNYSLIHDLRMYEQIIIDELNINLPADIQISKLKLVVL